MNVTDILIVIGLCIVGLAAVVIIPNWMTRRAIPKVIRAFRQNSAIDQRSAKTMDELGLKRRGSMIGTVRARDYRQQALLVLINSDIIRSTDDGRLFLDEGKMAQTGLDQRFNSL